MHKYKCVLADYLENYIFTVCAIHGKPGGITSGAYLKWY